MNQNEIEIDLGRLFRHYLQHWMALVSAGVICGFLAVGITALFITPQYRSSVTVYVNNIKSTQGIETITGNNLSAALHLVNTYVNIIKSDTVLEDVIQKGGLDCTANEIRQMMTAKQIEDTEMFRVTISHPNAKMAAKIANAIAEVAPERISGFVKGSSTEIIDYAKAAAKPYTPRYSRNIMLGGFFGVLLVGIILTLQFLFDMRIKTEEDAAAFLGVPVLGAIPEYEVKEEKSNRHHGKSGLEKRRDRK